MFRILTTYILTIFLLQAFATTYYVNDNSQTFDFYCTNTGNDLNSGLTPADPFATLTKAVATASSGDIILVDAGTYFDVNIDLTTAKNNLTITGASVSTTIFDGSVGSGVFNFLDITGSNITISNISIQFYDNAGAVDIISGSNTDSTYITFNNCYFDRNETYGFFDSNPHGGALLVKTGSGNLPAVVEVKNCQFSDNLAEQSQGGGAIFADGRSRLYIYGSRFVCNNSRAILTTYEGGAILFNTAYGTIDSCFISGSPVFDQQGGGFRAINSGSRLNIYILNTIFTENTGRQGAAFYIEDNYDCFVVNSLIYGNTVTGGFGNGGSISCDGAVNMSIVNSTIADNLSTHSSDGGGLAVDAATSYNVFNSIIWNNQISNVQSAIINATFSDIEPVNDLHSGTTGNIATNPLFTSASDYTLQGTSPCIDAGDLTGAPTTDLTNSTRTANPDMGVFENGSTNPTTSTTCSLFLICNPPSSLALSADDLSICSGNSTNVTLSSSEVGVVYQLINDNLSSNVGLPLSGTGGALSFPTGNLTSTTDFSILAYQISNPSCSTSLTPIQVTVVGSPSLTISNTSACLNETVTLTPTSGGSWISNNTSVATVTAGGIITLISDGLVDFTFTESVASCQSTTNQLTVNPLPSVTVSSNSVCEDGAITLTPNSGGSWISNNSAVANVTAGGIVTIVADGSVDFTFTESVNSCSATTSSVTVNPSPSVTVSSNSVCEDGAITLTPTSGGSWISNNTAVANVTAGGVVSIVADGSVDFTFTESVNSCSATTNSVTVNPSPSVTVSSNSVCEDGAITLTPTSGGSWISNNTAVANVTAGGIVTIVADGSVDFTFTESVNSCSATTSSVTVNPLPTVSTSTNSVCLNGILTLTPSSGGTWTSNNTAVATVSGSTVSLLSTGSVDFTFVEAVTGCSSTTGQVTVLPDLVINVANNGPVCEDSPLSLTSDVAGLSYNWSGPNGFSSTSQNPTVSLNATTVMAGNYNLTASDATCSIDVSTLVVVNPNPTIDVTSINLTNPSTCGGTNGEITGVVASGAPTLTYSWNGGASQSSPDLTSISSGSYTLVVTDGNGCSSSDGPFVLSDPSAPSQPSITLNPSAVCVGGEFTISVDSPDPSATYSWNGPNGYSSTGTSITLTNITTNEAGNYTVTPTIAGCTGGTSNPANVTVNSLPIVDILNAADITCTNTSVTLDGSNSESGANINYSWTTTNGNFTSAVNNNTASVDSDGNYRLIVTNSSTGCMDSLDVTVNFDNSLPISDAGSDITSTCSSDPLPVTLNGSGSSSGANIIYSWTVSGGGNIVSGGNSSTPVIDQAGTYDLQVTNTDNGCSANSSVSVIMDTISPVASDANNSMTSITCSSFFAATLDGSASSSGNGETYSWSTVNGTIDSQSGTQAIVTAGGDYILTVTGTNGCDASVTITVLMDTTSPFIVIPTPDSLSCINTTIALDASATIGTNVTYFWSTGETNSSISTDTAGIFNLIASNDNGCSSSITVEVFESGNPTADFTQSADSGTVVLNVDFDNLSTGSGLSYVWDFGDGGSSSNESPSYSYTASGVYNVQLIVTNNVGCSDTAYSIITVVDDSPIIIPNVFTPNNDGINDLFSISGNFKKMHLVIYNRWGQVMADLWGSKVKWDGRTMAGLEVPEGTYYYLIDIINFDDETFEFTGPLLLNR